MDVFKDKDIVQDARLAEEGDLCLRSSALRDSASHRVRRSARTTGSGCERVRPDVARWMERKNESHGTKQGLHFALALGLCGAHTAARAWSPRLGAHSIQKPSPRRGTTAAAAQAPPSLRRPPQHRSALSAPPSARSSSGRRAYAGPVVANSDDAFEAQLGTLSGGTPQNEHAHRRKQKPRFQHPLSRNGATTSFETERSGAKGRGTQESPEQ